jgi:hypothetical protein
VREMMYHFSKMWGQTAHIAQYVVISPKPPKTETCCSQRSSRTFLGASLVKFVNEITNHTSKAPQFAKQI